MQQLHADVRAMDRRHWTWPADGKALVKEVDRALDKPKSIKRSTAPFAPAMKISGDGRTNHFPIST
jgi:hypothetical protein